MTQLDTDLTALRQARLEPLARQYNEMATALKVIATWASYDQQHGPRALTPADVLKQTDKALKRFKE